MFVYWCSQLDDDATEHIDIESRSKVALDFIKVDISFENTATQSKGADASCLARLRRRIISISASASNKAERFELGSSLNHTR